MAAKSTQGGVGGKAGGGTGSYSSARAGSGSGGSATTPGGNLSGNKSSGTTATGFTDKQGVPSANSGIEQIGNTMQQAVPAIISGAGYGGYTLIDDVRDLYDRIEDVSYAYYYEFRDDATYWTNYYKPFLRDIYAQTAYRTLAYTGDGRGTANSNNNPDKDLFRRAQLAVQNTRELDIAWRTKRRLVSRYAHGAMRMDDLDTALQHMRIQIDNQLTAERMEDIYEDEFNNRKWNRLLMATNIGVTGTNAATQGYSTAMAAHIDSLRGMADYKSALGNQIASAAGNFIQSSFGD